MIIRLYVVVGIHPAMIKALRHCFCCLFYWSLNGCIDPFIWDHSACAKGLHKYKHDVNLLNRSRALSVLFSSIIERRVLMALVFYYKEMLEKATMQRTQRFSALQKRQFINTSTVPFKAWWRLLRNENINLGKPVKVCFISLLQMLTSVS